VWAEGHNVDGHIVRSPIVEFEVRQASQAN